MSVFTAAYPVGHPDPDHSVPAQDRRSDDAVEITDSLMKNRFSCRYYLPKPVEKQTIEEIIDAARHAPSGNNMQPWDKVYCITAQYLYYPAGPIPAKYAKRRFEFGKHFYAPLHVDHGDLKGRARFELLAGSWLDVGYFLQSITIAARARGLETISQEAPAKYQLILRKHLPIGDDEVVALGMSMGYPDLEKVAQFSAKQPKREVSDIVEFCGF
ncbi:Nitroreductase-like protein [Mycena haematopus]|nr:Nitroreductase-like protein [Mycena haematopus]